jgi:ParB/RepB/Spo0J family partition protein
MTQLLPIAQTTETTVEAVAPVAPTNALLLRRLGIDTLPSHETMYLPLDRLIVPGAEQAARAAARLVKSITQVGILQPPSVMLLQGSDIRADDARFEVVAGRRRTLAARLAGLDVIKCEVYAASTSQMASLLMLIENEQRSSAWVKEVEALHKLIDEHVGLTLDDLTAFGFDRASLRERLKVAHLPTPLVQQVLAGHLNHETARKLIRLTKPQQERIAALAATGEEITVAVVKHALRAHIDAGFAPMQQQLQEGWASSSALLPAASSGRFASARVPSPTSGSALTSPQLAPTGSLAQLVADLCRFKQSDDYQTVPQAVQSLTTALIQQVQVCLRSAPSHNYDNEKEY